MGDLDDLLAASSDAVIHAKQKPIKGCALKPEVSPVIAIAAPKFVLVKKAYQTKGHRLAVRIGTDVNFTGTGTLDAAPGGQLRVYDSKGVQQSLPMTIPGAKLSKGMTVYVESATPSAGMNSTTMSLSLTGGDKTIVNNPATDALTCVEVQLDLCQYKPASGGADPAPVADKLNTGRNLHLQTPDFWAGRALLIVRQARPVAYPGEVVLTSQPGGRVRTFAYGLETPGLGQPVQADPLNTPNATMGGGLKLWVEGADASAKVLDTGFTLGISDLPGVEGDRANITVVKAVLAVYDRPAKTGAKPPRLTDAVKMDPGRSLHLQDAGKGHGRARVVVKRVKPAAWVGDLELQVWDVAANSQANPRVNLLTGTAAASPAHVNPIGHPAAVSKDGKELWAEGAITSGSLHDTELRLRVTDAEGSADRARFTVHEFYVKEVTFQGVAEIYYARIPNAGSYILTPPAAPPKKHFSPVQLRPSGGAPHWRRKTGKNPAAEFSWPAVYARRKASGVPAPTLEAAFELFPKVPGSITAKVKADGGASGIRIKERDVTFTAGEAAAISFDIQKLPNTVKRLDGMELEWDFDGPGHKTKHTLFVLDTKPLAANNLGVDEYLWEIFEWSCRWADGVTGAKKVFGAIWAQFHPVKAAHDTGLVYWKDHAANPGGESQNLVDAIQSQEPSPPKVQYSASCIVFDRILINCIGAHGIPSAEIKLMPPSTTFTRGGVTYESDSWHDTTTEGQGNKAAPPDWGSHWIAAVKLGGWKYYDASYGDGPVKAPEPGAQYTTVDVLSYEPKTVASFNCVNVAAGTFASLPRDPDKNKPPHLMGVVLWTNK